MNEEKTKMQIIEEANQKNYIRMTGLNDNRIIK